MALPLKPPFPPMEARSVDQIPADGGWQYEPKWDGFRCLAFRDGTDIYLQSKAGQSLARYFPDVVDAIGKLSARNFIIDGELAIPVGNALSFDELQLRLHPAASRVQKLANAHPAILIVFDILAKDRQLYLTRPLQERRAKLEQFARAQFKPKGEIRLSPATTKLVTAKKWFEKVGFTSAFKTSDRRALTKKFEGLKKPPGFTGNAPGGPSRWTTERSGEWEPVDPKIVVEVAYDHFTGGRFRHGTKILRWRPDKAPRQCTMDQVEHREGKSLALL
jgi:ATP-dependent DNA ligase